MACAALSSEVQTSSSGVVVKHRQISESAKFAEREFARRLRAWRAAKGLTQMDLAYKAKLSLETLRAYEQGRRVPRITEVVMLADAMGMASCDLLFRDAPKQETQKRDDE